MDRKKILVIDDDVSVLSALSSTLTDEGFDVSTAESASHGLDLLPKYGPDLIILDLKMPGMSGVGFLNEISGPDGKLKFPVLVLTAHGNMSSFFKNLDIDGFMLKPLRGEDLLAEVRRILSVRSGQKRAVSEIAMSRKRTVLIAEDDNEVSKTLALAFSGAGYATEQTNNGSDAIGKAILLTPDVLVIKAVLSSLNGNKVASILRTVPKTSHLPIILYDQDGSANPTTGLLAKTTGDVTAFVPSNSATQILAAANRVLGGH